MFIAHLPAGYLITATIQRRTGNRTPRVLWAGLVASVFPDIDLFYFYLFDDRRTPHHAYITHMPMAWLAAALVTTVALKVLRKGSYLIYVGVILANVMAHMVMDSIAAEIDWLYPFANGEVNLVPVPARYHWWVWNFVLHWTFGLELLIIAAALWIGIRRCKRPS